MKRIPTNYKVWNTIKSEHKDLVLLNSYSAADGDIYGGPERCKMITEYGFKGCDSPIMGAETTWDRNIEEPHTVENEINEYWLYSE